MKESSYVRGVDQTEWIRRVERPVSWSSFPYGKGNEMIYQSGHIYLFCLFYIFVSCFCVSFQTSF